MKKLWILYLLIAVIILACTPAVTVKPVEETPEPAVLYVYDSAWNLRDLSAALPSARDLTVPASLQAFVDEYNETHTDDQLTITEEEVPVEEAPTCELWIVDATTYEVKITHDPWGNEIPYHLTGLPRSEVYDRREAWRLDCIGVGNGMLFVDRDPPAPIPPPVEPVDDRPDYEKYALYLFDATGALIAEDHCEDIGDYPSKLAYFNARKEAYAMDCVAHPGWTYIAGRLWSPETPEEPAE